MSKFKTSIPVDVESIKKLLPEGAYLHGVEWDKQQSDVNILWEHDKFVTPHDFATEFPRANLEQEKLPDGVKFYRPPKPKQAEAPPVVTQMVAALTPEKLAAVEFEAGMAMARAGRPIIDCQTEDARRGYESAQQKPAEPVATPPPGGWPPVETATGGGAQTETIAPPSGTVAVQNETIAPETVTVLSPEATVATPQGVVPTGKPEGVAGRKGRR